MPQKNDCKHVWIYITSVYSFKDHDCLVRRVCDDCGLEQVGEVTLWRPPVKDEFDHTIADALTEQFNRITPEKIEKRN